MGQGNILVSGTGGGGGVSGGAFDGWDLVYQPASGKTGRITKITVCNYSGAARTFHIAVSPDDVAVRYLHHTRSLAGGETFTMDGDLFIYPQMLLGLDASGASVDMAVFGDEEG